MIEPLFQPPRDVPWLKPYWDGLAAGELRLPRCRECGSWSWYPLETGPSCHDADYEWRGVGPSAAVFTFTRVDRPLIAGLSEPYLTGLVVTDDAPSCRIAALFSEADGEIEIGTRVRLAFAGFGEKAFPYFVREGEL